MLEQGDEDGVSSTSIRRSQRVPRRPFRFIESDEGSDTDDADAVPSDSGGRTDSVAADDSGNIEHPLSVENHEGNEINQTVVVNEQVPQRNSQVDRVKWGNLVGVEAIRREVDEVYQQITTWQKNILGLHSVFPTLD